MYRAIISVGGRYLCGEVVYFGVEWEKRSRHFVKCTDSQQRKRKSSGR